MNLLLFEQAELKAQQLFLIGRRADHIKTVLRLKVGDTLRVGMINGPRGEGEVEAVTGDQVTVQVRLGEVVLPVVPSLSLILALPRPIMLRRILKQATVMGVSQFYLIRSNRVEKSFFQSPVLEAESLQGLLLEGMEQGMLTQLPRVSIHPRFKPFVEDILPEQLAPENRMIAHPTATAGLIDLYPLGIPTAAAIALAIGPEGGWNEYEVDALQAQGFTCFQMGKRILHVDTAVVALLSQVQLLQDLANR